MIDVSMQQADMVVDYEVEAILEHKKVGVGAVLLIGYSCSNQP